MRLRGVAALLLSLLPSLGAQQWDNSGNALLQGQYNFRHVAWVIGDKLGNLKRSVSLYGTINFDGNGSYSLNAFVFDSDVKQQQTFSTKGTYSIAASGQGFLSSPVLDTGSVFGVVAQGIFVGSSPEDVVNDLFIAAPAASTPPGVGDFSGKYWVTEMNFPGTAIAQARDALFAINPDGRGNLGNVSVTGNIGDGSALNQSVLGATYTFTNGVGNAGFGGASGGQTLLAGNRTFYLSPDGNFLFGGSTDGWNMMVGVRALTRNAPSGLLAGLFYQAGVDVDMSDLANGANMHTYYGAFQASQGVVLGQQRVLSGFSDTPYDYTYSDIYTIAPDGSADDFLGFRNILGADGAIRIGFGQSGVPGISISVKAPSFSGPGVFLDPTGIVSGASFAPFTAAITRGQLLSLSGTNLAASSATDSTYPTTLAGVQVLVNNRPAPIQSVSPTSVQILVPYGTIEPVAQIQVVNNSTVSNTVTAFLNTTQAGVFTVPAGGFGYADAVHADSSPVTPSNPAKAGESITVRVTGLGAVNPPVPDGTAAPTDKSATAVSSLAVYLGGQKANVTFAGLAPGQIGQYQITFTVPAGIRTADPFLDIAGPDCYTSMTQIAMAAPAKEPVGNNASRNKGDTGRPFSHRPKL